MPDVHRSALEVLTYKVKAGIKGTGVGSTSLEAHEGALPWCPRDLGGAPLLEALLLSWP